MNLRKSAGRWWSALAEVDPDARVFAACYLALLPFYLWPLLVTRLLPGLDLPFHLSMVDMLSKAGRADSPYDRFYQGAPMLAPYAIHYVALWVLGKAMALATAHKIIIAAYVASVPLAAASLLGVCGRSRIPALLAFPLAYNLTLHYGFVSSAMSLPVVLLLLAQLTRLLTQKTFEVGDRDWRLAWRWVATALAAFLLFLSHLQNFLYGVCAGLTFVVFCRTSWRRRALAVAAFLPALGALSWWHVRSSFDGDALAQRKTLAYVWSAVKGARLADIARRPLADDLLDRIYSLPSHALRSFQDGVDTRAARTLLVLVLLYFFLGLGGRAASGEAGRVRPRMVVACWVAFAGVLFAYLALPHHLLTFELMTFFPRFAPLAMAMMLPLIPAGLVRFSGELRLLLPVPALLFGLLYGRELVKHYRLFATETEDFVAMLDRAEPGHKALGLVFDRQSRVMHIESILVGLPNYYVAAHRSPASMTPLWYCGMRHIPCRHKPGFAALPDPGPWEPYRLDPELAVPFFDYFFVRSPPSSELFGRHQGAVELLAHQGTWWLWRRRPPVPPGPFDRPYDD
jgi:hypothetical protein